MLYNGQMGQYDARKYCKWGTFQINSTLDSD